jgi:methylated-DNA-[protein]-cysteine S-methyltransferase
MAEGETIIYEVRVLEQTPIGPLTVYVSDGGLARIDFARLVEVRTGNPELEKMADLAVQELTEYFYAGRRNFTLGIDWRGMQAYQEKVLRACLAVPYGQVRTYGELAHQTGSAGSARAVGGIMASNPIPIVIPCHRVVGSDGKLHGYGSPGGVDDKALLLTLEGQRIVA